MVSSQATNGTIDVALDVAAPILDFLESALDLAPVPGLGLIPKALSTVVEDIKVCNLLTLPDTELKVIVQGARSNDESKRAFDEQVKLLSSVLEKTVGQAESTVATYHGNAENKRKVAQEIAQSQELQD